MKPIRVLAAIAVASGTFVAVACSIDVDVTNKECPCGPGYVCDTTRNVCVTPAELPDSAIVLEDGNVIVPDGAVPCPDDKCPCSTDVDCKDPARKKCLTDTKTCVECLRAPNDSCPAGQYCNDQNLCTLGCKQETDCQIASPAVPHCNLTLHQCVQCLEPSHCPGDAGLLCSPSGTCVEGCNLEAGVGCTAGKTCCGQLCLDLSNDALNCGACDNKCSTVNATPSCSGGNCSWNCAFGFRHCASGNTGCEANIRTDVTKCGSCFRNCLNDVQNADGISCNPTSMNCQYASCKVGFGNCNGFNGDGCECSCGSFAGEICCPGGLCTFPGGQCVGQNPPKCQ
jgi:hypothetical protein